MFPTVMHKWLLDSPLLRRLELAAFLFCRSFSSPSRVPSSNGPPGQRRPMSRTSYSVFTQRRGEKEAADLF